MAPKGSKRLPNQIGSVHQHLYGWRVRAFLFGHNVEGPARQSKKQAHSDLAVAQQTETQEKMRDFLRLLRTSCQEEGQSLTADVLWHRLQQTCRQAGDVNAAGVATHSITGGSSASSSVRPASDHDSDEYESMSQSQLADLVESRGFPKRHGGNRKTKLALIQELRAQDALKGQALATQHESGHSCSGTTCSTELSDPNSKSEGASVKPSTCQAEAMPSSASIVSRSGPASARAATMSLIGRRSSAKKRKERLEAQRQRQSGTKYKERRRAREITKHFRAQRKAKENSQKYRLAQNSRRKRADYKQKKRVYERSAKAKLSRLQRRWARFWAPCLYNWNALRSDRASRLANNNAVYAPRFHTDGRISILQQGVEKYLPCPQEPTKGANQKQSGEFLLALELRCRIGATNCRRFSCSGNHGCSKKLDARLIRQQKAREKHQALPVLPNAKPHFLNFGGCVHTGRLRHHTNCCPLRQYDAQEFEDDLEDILLQDLADKIFHGMPGSASICQIGPSTDFFVPNMWTPNASPTCDVLSLDAEKRSLPKPSREVRQFLCNDRCPQQCCTLHCPWNSMRDPHLVSHTEIIDIFGSPCFCNSWTCRTCVQERYLQRICDLHPLSVVSEPGSTLQSPPPPHCTLYVVTGEPVSDSYVSKSAPKLYKLTCVPWQVKDEGGELPQWLAQSNDLAEFLNSNGFNTPQNYRLRNIGSYQECMQPVHDKYSAVAGLPWKVYGHARGYWTPEEVQTWNVTGPPACGSGDECARESGWEWRWQEDVDTWTQAEILIEGKFERLCDAFSATGDLREEWVELADGRLASTRCSFCTFMHGQPESRNKVMSIVHPGVPEDIAIGVAELLVKLRNVLTRVDRRLCPADVVRTAEKFDVILPGVGIFIQEPSPIQAFVLLSLFEPKNVVPDPLVDAAGVPGSASSPADSFDMQAWGDFLQDHYADLSDLLGRLNCVVEAFRDSFHKATTSWKIYGRAYKRRPYLVEATCHTKLYETYTQELLKRTKFHAPVFALADGNMSFKPRLTRSFAIDCQCNTPWHERSLWERQPWVAYELPLVDAGQQFGRPVATPAAVRQIAPAPVSVENATRDISSRVEFKPGFASPRVGNRAYAECAGEQCDDREAAITEKWVSPTSGSAILQHQLLVWTSEDEAAGSSEASEMQQNSEDVDIDGPWFEEGGQEERPRHETSESDEGGHSKTESSWDADDPEGYGDCPQTPPRKTCDKFAELGQSVQKEARPKFLTDESPVCDGFAKGSHASVPRWTGSAASECVALVPASGSAVRHQDTTANDDQMHSKLLEINARSQRELLERHPQLRRYVWSSGPGSMCMEWHCKSENPFVVTHSCGVVHCGWCYEDHQGQCKDPIITTEIQATREALFEKHPELRSQTPISGQCTHCLEELSVVHQFLFQHCCGVEICSDCYVHHLSYCEGGACHYDAFVFGDDESSDDYGIPCALDVRDETWQRA